MSAFEEMEEIDDNQLIRKDKGVWRRECELRKQCLENIIKLVGKDLLD